MNRVETELLPCPFCGGPAAIRSNEDVGNAWVSCDACLAQSGGFGDTTKPIHRLREFAVEEWNRRSTPIAAGGGEDFAETLNFYISDCENGISRVPRQKLVEIQNELRALRAALSTAGAAEPTPAEAFALWLADGPRLAKAAGCYVGIKVSAAAPQGGGR